MNKDIKRIDTENFTNLIKDFSKKKKAKRWYEYLLIKKNSTRLAAFQFVMIFIGAANPIWNLFFATFGWPDALWYNLL